MVQQLALEVARKFSAQLMLLHVYSAPVYMGAFGEVHALPLDAVENLKGEAVRALEDLRQRAAAVGISAETLIVEGSASHVIVSMARSGDVDMIVMGTHGHTGLKHLLLGSVTERVVRMAECPVLTMHVPEPSEPAYESEAVPGML